LKVFNNVKRKLKKGSNARKRTLSFTEFLKLIGESPEHLRNVLIVAFNTGMRKGEIRKLRWSHVDFESMFIRLPVKITKEGRDKDIPINHHVKAVLDSLRPSLGVVSEGHHDFVFSYNGKPIKGAGGLRRSLKTACEKVGIVFGRNVKDGFIFHDIRRTVKTNMLAAGVQKEYRDIILGHSLQGMDTHYIVPDENTLCQSMEQYTHWIDDQIRAIFENVDHSVDQERVEGVEGSHKALNGKVLKGGILSNIDDSGDKKDSLCKGLKIMVPPAGIEPAAHGLGIHCSIH
jgi:integrase